MANLQVNGTTNTVEWQVFFIFINLFLYELVTDTFRITSGKWKKNPHVSNFFFFFIETWLIVLKNWLKFRYLRCSLLHSSLDSDAFHDYQPWPATSQAALPVSAKCVLKTSSGLPKITMERFISVLSYSSSYSFYILFMSYLCL